MDGREGEGWQQKGEYEAVVRQPRAPPDYTLDLNNIDGLLESAFFVHW